MALSRSETIERADTCTNKAIEIQQEISKVLSELADFQGEVSQVSSSVSKSIKAEDITVGCSKSLGNVNKKISECSTKIFEFIQGLAKDCNTYIEKLENDYNNDLAERKRKAKEKNEPEITESELKLKRVNIGADGSFSLVDKESLQASLRAVSTTTDTKGTGTGGKTGSGSATSGKKVGGTGSSGTSGSTGTSSTGVNGTSGSGASSVGVGGLTSGGTSGTSSSGTGTSGSTGSGTSATPTSTGSNGYTQSFIDKYKVQLDYVLNQNILVGIDSSKINNWDAFIMDFIKINGFDSKVKGISLNSGIVKCELLNGQKYDFQNIKSYSDLVDAIKKVI